METGNFCRTFSTAALSFSVSCFVGVEKKKVSHLLCDQQVSSVKVVQIEQEFDQCWERGTA